MGVGARLTLILVAVALLAGAAFVAWPAPEPRRGEGAAGSDVGHQTSPGLAAIGREGARPDPERAGEIEGRTSATRSLLVEVVGDEGEPIPNADVRVRGEDPSEIALTGRSAADGRVEFPAVSASWVGVSAGVEGRLDAPCVWVDGSRGSGPLEARIVLRSGLSVSGRVRFPDGTPLAGGEIRMDRSRDIPCGADGAFRVRGLNPGAVDLEIYAERDGRDHALVTRVDAGSEGLDLVLAEDENARVLIRVVGPDGKPVPISQVGMFGGGKYGLCDTEAHAVHPRPTCWPTRARWVFVSRAMAEDSSSLPFGWVVEGPFTAPPSDLTVRLPHEAVLTGFVRGPDGRGVERVTVRAKPYLDVGDEPVLMKWWFDSRATDAAGAFRFGGLGVGDFEVSVEAPPGFVAPPPRRITLPSEGAEVVLLLSKANTLRGIAVDERGAPVPGAAIWRRNSPSGESSDGWDRAASADAQGAFAMETLGREVTLRGGPAGCSLDETLPIETTFPAGATDVVLRVDPGEELLVHVTNWKEHGAGEIVARASLEGSSEIWGHSALVIRGEARVCGLSRGREYVLCVRCHNDGSCAFVERVRAGTREVSVRLEEGRSIRGRVVLRPGTRSVEVWARRAACSAAGIVDAAGRYEIRGLPPGTFSVWASFEVEEDRDDYEASGTVEAGGTLDLEPKSE